MFHQPTYLDNLEQQKLHKPNQCPFIGLSNIELKSHFTTHPYKQLIKCDVRSRELKGRLSINLQRYIQSKRSDIWFKCEQWGKDYSLQNSLKTHVNLIHGGKKYLCDQCDFTANPNHDLKKHNESIHSSSTYVCHSCSY